MIPRDELGRVWDDYEHAERKLLARHGVDATSRWVDAPTIGGRAHVLMAGEGPPVVMVIGGGPPPAMWAPLMAELSGVTMFVLDLPGMGRTPPVSFTTEGLRALAVGYLDDVIGALDPGPLPVIAQSMGGLWSTWLAIDRPERVRSLALVGCPAFLLGTSAPLPMRVAARPWLARLVQRIDPPSPAQVRRFVKMAGEDFSTMPELRHLFLAFERLPDTTPALFDLLAATLRLRGPRPEVELTAADLARLRQPVQMIWGDGDTFGSPSVGARAAEIIPDGRLHVVPGGHAPWVSGPQRVGGLITAFHAAHASRSN